MNLLDIGRASFLGHSWGGGWVLHFAHCHPERVESLILVGSSGLNVSDVLEWELLKYPLIGSLLLKSLTPAAVKKRLMRSFHSMEPVTEQMVHEVYLPMKFQHNRRLQLLIARSQDWSITERALPLIRRPSLIVWGENDRYLPVGLVRRFEEGLKNVKSFVLKECGHSPHEERPDEVNAAITAFLQAQRG
jgi:pimeloyl-ACP methyl ester carboxylesterase